jgi:hypothetical protein
VTKELSLPKCFVHYFKAYAQGITEIASEWPEIAEVEVDVRRLA